MTHKSNQTLWDDYQELSERLKDRILKAAEIRDAEHSRKTHSEETMAVGAPQDYDEEEYLRFLETVIDQCNDRIHLLHLIFPELKAIPIRQWPYKEGLDPGNG